MPYSSKFSDTDHTLWGFSKALGRDGRRCGHSFSCPCYFYSSTAEEDKALLNKESLRHEQELTYVVQPSSVADTSG